MNVQYATISPSHPDYPDGLAGVIPNTTLFAVGHVSLLGRRAVGICGSRAASVEALQWAYDFGAEAAKLDYVVVSGYARGVDRQAHKGALESGGATIAVLAEGIQHFRLVTELKSLVDVQRNFLAISMFEPDAIWTTWRATERNKAIVGLSIALFVIEARERGGTIRAAMECVRQKKPLFAIAYPQSSSLREGNRKLLKNNCARPIELLGDMERALEQATSQLTPRQMEQLALSLP